MNKLGQVLRAEREGLAPARPSFTTKPKEPPPTGSFLYNETVEFEKE
jgi:hypothetical protein